MYHALDFVGDGALFGVDFFDLEFDFEPMVSSSLLLGYAGVIKSCLGAQMRSR